MENNHSDIDQVIHEIERADIIAQDSSLKMDIRDEAFTRFMRQNSDALIELLDELKSYRNQNQAGGQQGIDKTHRIILEGYSDKNAEAALSDALDKASHFFAEDKDIVITIQQLIELPNGGHRATVEVHITPLTLHDSPHVKGEDVVLKRDHEHAYRTERQQEEDALRYLIFDHFSGLTNAKTRGHIPAHLIINVNEAKLMHYMLEKEFIRAEKWRHQVEKNNEISPIEPDHHPTKIKVNVIHKDLE